MGYILSPIAVDLDRVAAAIGSKDSRLLDEVCVRFADEFGQIDEMAADLVEDFEEEGRVPLTVREALRQMIFAAPYEDDLGFVYGYALKYLCQHLGDSLPNDWWSAMPSSVGWAETVDQGLEDAGIPEASLRALGHLMFRSAPIELPLIDDFPAIGHLTRDEAREAHRALAAARLDGIDDEEVVAAIEQARDWLRTCSDSGRGLICFTA